MSSIDKNKLINDFQQIIYENIPNLIGILNIEQINAINESILKLFNFNDSINNQYTISNKDRIHKDFLKNIKTEYEDLFKDILKYRIQVSKKDIYEEIIKLIQERYIYNTNTIYLLWNYDYGITKSVINYNFLFLHKLHSLSLNNLYITNFTPETLISGEEIDDPVNLSELDIDDTIIYNCNHQYFIFDDISYSGTQLMEDCNKWFLYIITNYNTQLSSTTQTYTFNIFLYGITLNAYQSYHKFISYLKTIEMGNYIGVRIIFNLNYKELLYSTIPFVFKRYIQIRNPTPNFINNDIYVNQKDFNNIPLIFLQRYNNTEHILDKLGQQQLIQFGDFYFANEVMEYKLFKTKRLQTLIYLDYKIPDTRSINDRLFFGFVPEYLLNDNIKLEEKQRKKPYKPYNKPKNIYKIIGTFLNYPVYQLKLFDTYNPTLINYNFRSITNSRVNPSNLIDKDIQKPLIPWYKK